MNPKVDGYFRKSKEWQEELKKVENDHSRLHRPTGPE
jgi:hypothetical protein